MQLIITDLSFARSKAIYLNSTQLLLSALIAAFMLMLIAAGLYHWVFLNVVREVWPVLGSSVRLVVKDEAEQRERYMHENIDAMARKLGEVQAKVLQLETLGERVSGLAGLKPLVIKGPPGRGGALISSHSLTMGELQRALDDVAQLADEHSSVMTEIESRLIAQKMKKMMVPTQHPVAEGNLGSAFGWRIDPILGSAAFHNGLDFQADVGTPIVAAAAGIVVTQEFNPSFGNMVEIDHGNGLITRYAHASKVWVKKGELIRRGQEIAEVGTTGRSTGPHLHFEVLMQGVPQDPQKFLNAGLAPVKGTTMAQRDR